MDMENMDSGEPVPPGFEDEVTRPADIQKVIQNYKGNALIGLEYAIELHENGRAREPYYMCVLCDKRCDPRTIMQHWTSIGHRQKYLNIHFPTAMGELTPIINKPDKMKVMVQLLSEAIERHHGRLQLSVCSSEEFRRSKNKIFDDVKAKFHYDERNGPNFVNVIDRSLLQSTSQQKPDNSANKSGELDEISSDSDGGSGGGKKGRHANTDNRHGAPTKRPADAVNEDARRDSQKTKLPTPKELSMQATHLAQERYKWEKYRCLLEIYLKQADKTFKEYDKNPEKHPLYPEEWKAFWNRRYKELQKEKKVDPNKYDYRPEWVVFWSKRRKEIFDKELEKKKKELKSKLDLPEDAEEVLDRLKERYKIHTNRNENSKNGNEGGSKSNGKGEDNVIDISDDEPEKPSSSRDRPSHSRSRAQRNSRSISPRSRNDSKRPRKHSRSRSISPFSDDYDYNSRQTSRSRSGRAPPAGPPPPISSFSSRRYPPGGERSYHDNGHSYYNHSAVYSSRYHNSSKDMFSMHPQYDRTLSMSPPPPHMKRVAEPEPEPEEEGPLTVVAVLRLLTALEDILGSLGPKMIDLLGKALALDNVKANSADELLLNEDNVVFFETAKEKLKGLLIAEVIEDPQKIRAVKKAIKNIAAIVHQVTSNKGKKVDKKEDATPSVSNTNADKNTKMNTKVSMKDLPFDRQLVASKLASELVKEGREDLSTDDMDKLIYFFILMTKLSKSKREIDGEPLHLKDIASEIGMKMRTPTPTPAAPVAAKLKESSVFAAKPSHNLLSFVGDLLGGDLNDAEISNDKSEKSAKTDAGSSLESLTDSDLQTLLQNFKYLSSEEQHHLIAHLKKLETSDPLRVEKLRKFVNLNDLEETAGDANNSQNATSTQRNASSSDTSNSRRSGSKNLEDNSPRRQHSRSRGIDSDDDENSQQTGRSNVNPNKFSLDDEDDDDYNFDDVLKSASNIVDNNIRQSKTTATTTTTNRYHESGISKSSSSADPPAPGTKSHTSNTSSNITLKAAQNLLDNIMGSIQQNNASKQSTNKEPIQTVQPVQSIVSTPQNAMPAQSNVPFYQAGYPQQQQYSQQYPQYPQHQQQQQPMPPQPPVRPPAFGVNNQMPYSQPGYMGNDSNNFYGYNNSYLGYTQPQPPQQWGGNYNMYGGN